MRIYSAFRLGVCAYARIGIYQDGIFKVFRSGIFNLSLFLRNLITIFVLQYTVVKAGLSQKGDATIYVLKNYIVLTV
jgi:hypothetical protein